MEGRTGTGSSARGETLIYIINKVCAWGPEPVGVLGSNSTAARGKHFAGPIRSRTRVDFDTDEIRVIARRHYVSFFTGVSLAREG